MGTQLHHRLLQQRKTWSEMRSPDPFFPPVFYGIISSHLRAFIYKGCLIWFTRQDAEVRHVWSLVWTSRTSTVILFFSFLVFIPHFPFFNSLPAHPISIGGSRIYRALYKAPQPHPVKSHCLVLISHPQFCIVRVIPIVHLPRRIRACTLSVRFSPGRKTAFMEMSFFPFLIRHFMVNSFFLTVLCTHF